ncbi:MAG: TolC family protein, partial [Leptospiraceae bacterium]|nr:TolC family protein [Leptospiraceae bacterium]
ENIKMIKMVQNAKRTKESYKANLTVMMGVPNDSELVINDLPESFKIDENKFPELLNYALINRPEIFLNEKEILSLKKRTELLFMDKVPNLTIGGFAQRDGFNENVIGASISLPLKVWRNNSGEIQENIASTEKAISRGEIQKHSIKYEIINAISKYTSYKNELNSFSDDLINRIDLSLEGLQKAVTTGQIQIREALLTRQSLINLKLSHLESRRDILLSGIELIRASGLPFLHGEKEIEN